jgi:hypothetical protein
MAGAAPHSARQTHFEREACVLAALRALGGSFTIGDFDISPDGRELLFDRSSDESDIVLIERPK